MKETWGERYDRQGSFTSCVKCVQAHMPFLEMVESHTTGKRLLETGIGTGTMTMYFTDRGYEVVGLDNDDRVIARAERISSAFGKPLTLVKGDMRALPFEDRCFDTCYHQGVLEHFSPEEIRRILLEQLRVAETVVFSVPGEKWPQKNFGDENLWPLQKWREILKPYCIVAEEGYEFDIEYTRRITRLPWRALPRRIWDGIRMDHAKEYIFVVRR